MKYFHFPTPDGINNSLRIGGKGSLTAKHNFDHVAIPESFEHTKGSEILTKNNEVKYEGKSFNYVSLFSGIGGFEQAFNKLGGNCVLASEIDKFAEQSYQALYGHATAGDITQIDTKDVPDHDVLVGGFPCQSFSVAGKRKGFEDVRGTLFFEIARIAKEKQPKVLLLENVKGLVNHDKGKTLNVMLETLCEIGYTIDFTILNSKYFGVPQNRERIFIVAVRDDLVTPEPWLIEGSKVVPKGKRRVQSLEGIKAFNFNWPAEEESTARLRDILETDVDEKYYLSDDKVAALVKQLDKKDVDDVPSVIHNIYGGFKETKPRIFKGVSPTIRTSAGGGHLPSLIEEIRPILTPERAEKRQNGRRFKEDGEPAFTVNTQDRHGVAIGQSPKFRIRKLTPRECWRLQGFSDELFDVVEESEISDSQLYKMAGNAVTINVVEAIGEKLMTYLNDDIE